MIRFCLRALGFALMASAFAGLVVDGTRTIASEHLLQYSLADLVAWAGGPRYAAWADEVVRLPEPVRQMASTLLTVPGWIVTGGLGLLMLHAGRPPATHVGLSDHRT